MYIVTRSRVNDVMLSSMWCNWHCQSVCLHVDSLSGHVTRCCVCLDFCGFVVSTRCGSFSQSRLLLWERDAVHLQQAIDRQIDTHTSVSPLSAVVLRAFAKFLKATISFVKAVRPSAWNNSAPTGRMLMKFYAWVLRKICRENSSFVKIRQE